MEAIKIISVHIEGDKRNGTPTLVYTDADNIEWVHEEQSSSFGGYITMLVMKDHSWYWRND